MQTGEPPILDWGPEGGPRSRLYGDVYFSTQDGLAESRAVFLQGCDLPQAWQGRSQFTVAELGFGTGLNILALLDLWRAARPPGARLNIFSIEAHPLSRQEAGRALACWPELAELAGILLDAWPGAAAGFHRLDLPQLSATLDLAIMQAAPALRAWSGQADAWFLDGFSPALNPAMWSEEVLGLVGERSAPGAAAATFTVAGAVRRGLSGAGFQVDKRAGFGRKRERLEARRPGRASPEIKAGRVAVLGAGIAGASLARALRALGREVMVIDPRGVGGGASGNAAALVSPRLDAGLGRPARLHAQAFRRALDLYAELPQALISRGAVVLEAGPRDAGRFDKIVACDLFEPGEVARLTSAQAGARLGEPVGPGLSFASAPTIEPLPVLEAWCGEILADKVERLEPRPGRWVLGLAGGGQVEAQQVMVASGADTRRLFPGLPLQPVRGQVSVAAGVATDFAASFGGYVTPARQGLLFGSTFDRDDEDESPRAADRARNLRQLASVLPGFAARLEGAPIGDRASIRAAMPDRLPLAGEAQTGLFILSGLGSHGFCLAPLLGEAVAAMASGLPSPLPRDLLELVDPQRYLRAKL